MRTIIKLLCTYILLTSAFSAAAEDPHIWAIHVSDDKGLSEQALKARGLELVLRLDETVYIVQETTTSSLPNDRGERKQRIETTLEEWDDVTHWEHQKPLQRSKRDKIPVHMPDWSQGVVYNELDTQISAQAQRSNGSNLRFGNDNYSTAMINRPDHLKIARELTPGQNISDPLYSSQ